MQPTGPQSSRSQTDQPSAGGASNAVVAYSIQPPITRLILEELPEGIRVTEPLRGRTSASIGALIFAVGLAVLAYTPVSQVRNIWVRVAVTAIGAVVGGLMYPIMFRTLRQQMVMSILPHGIVLEMPGATGAPKMDIPYANVRGLRVVVTSTSVTLRSLGALHLKTSTNDHYLFRRTPVTELEWVIKAIGEKAAGSAQLKASD